MGIELLSLYRQKVKKEWKIAFLSVLIFGLMVHIYKFTNTLPNHDTYYNTYSNQNVIGSGRWALIFACAPSSYFDLPWINGQLSVLYLSIAAVIIVDTLEIKNPVLIFLISALLVSFPAVTETFFFQFTADGYMVALIAACLAVWASKIEHLNIFTILFATLCVCASCAIYQAYLSFALLLALCYFILKLLDNALTPKQIRKWILSQLFIYIVGLVIYYVFWKVIMAVRGHAAYDYAGISTLSLNLDTIVNAFSKTFLCLKIFFFEESKYEYGWRLYGYLNLVFLILSGLVLIYAIIKTKTYRKPGSLVLIALCLVAAPFFACIWLFTSDQVMYRPMMLMSLCVLYIFTAILFEKYCHKITKNLFAVFLAIIIFNNAIIANICYYFMNRSYYASYATAVEMLYEIHDLDTDTKEIAVIGTSGVDNALTPVRFAPKIRLFSDLLDQNLVTISSAHLLNFVNETFYEDFYAAPDAWKSDSSIVSTVSQMPCWPKKDSIQVLDNIIFIKVSDEPIS